MKLKRKVHISTGGNSSCEMAEVLPLLDKLKHIDYAKLPIEPLPSMKQVEKQLEHNEAFLWKFPASTGV